MAAIRSLTLLELVGETMRRLLNEIAQLAPAWLKAQMPTDWIKRYGCRFDSYHFPKSQEKRDALALQIGEDGFGLLASLTQASTPRELQSLALVDVLRRIWLQQFYVEAEQVHWRTKKQWGQPPAHLMIASPEDLDASYCVKRSTEWTGYKVHLSETCDENHPRLITQVETTPATTHDVKLTARVQDDLAARDLLPQTHLVDAGYMETDLLVESQAKGIDLVGPMPSYKSWQSRIEDAFDNTQFVIDWERKQASCPGGKTSAHYAERTLPVTPLMCCLPFAWRTVGTVPCVRVVPVR